MKPACFRHGSDSSTVEVQCDNSATTATTDNLRKCYGCVKEVPRISHGSLRLCYELLRLCYGIAGSDRVKPWSHYGVDGMLRLCNGSATSLRL